MHATLLASAASLSDKALLQRLSALAAREREAAVELIAHLAEFDRRKLHRAEGFGSLFSYCTEGLRLSEHAAYKRIVAARASRRFPVLLDRLADGSLNLSTVCLLAPHLTPENHETVLAEAKGRSKREVETLVARLSPKPDVPASVRKLPVRIHERPTAAATRPIETAPTEVGFSVPTSSSLVSAPAAVAATAPAQVPPAHRAVVAPVSPARFRVQFTVGMETQEKLHRAQDLLRREIPDGDLGAIFDRALTLLLEDVARKKLAATSKPRPGAGTAVARSRHVPAHVKRAVWLRDGGQCAFMAASGRRCRERAFLEFHHIDPYGVGGETTVANLSLRCRAHNVYEAERVFGPRAPVVRETRAVYDGIGSTRPGAS